MKEQNDKLTKNIRIYFEKNSEGKFILKSIDTSNNAINHDNKIITVNESNLAKLLKKENINFNILNGNNTNTFVLDIPANSYEKLDIDYQQLVEVLNQNKSYFSECEIKEHIGIKCFCVKFNDLEKEKDNKDEKDNKVEKEQEENQEPKMVDLSAEQVLQKRDEIKEKILGQDNVINEVVNQIYINQKQADSEEEHFRKANHIFIDGPTGTGKSAIIKQISKSFNIPLTIHSSTEFSAAGYQGQELKSVFESLLKQTNGDLKAAEKGIVVLDEFDKLGNSNLEMKENVQSALLTYLGGENTFEIEYNGQKYNFDPSSVTFVCLGAFTDILEKKQENLDENGNFKITTDDYIKEGGIMRELMGRFSLKTSTRYLDKEDLKRIMKESKISPLRRLEDAAKKFGKEVVYDEEFLDKLAEMASEMGTGARALNSMLDEVEKITNEEMIYDKNSNKIELTTSLLDKVKDSELRKGVAK